MSRQNFIEAANAGAYDVVLAGYRAVRSTEVDARAQMTKNLINSPPFKKVMEDQPWFAVDIAFACLENIPVGDDRKKLADSEAFMNMLLTYSQTYPQAAVWYADETQRLVEVFAQDPNRQEWQLNRRGVLAGLQKMREEKVPQATIDVITKMSMEKLAELPVLKEIGKVAPWSALDIYKALTDALPGVDKVDFAHKYLLASPEYLEVQKDCEPLAAFYLDYVEGLVLKAVKAAPTPKGQEPA